MMSYRIRLRAYFFSVLAIVGFVVSSLGQLYAAPLGNTSPYGVNTNPANSAVFFLRKNSAAGVQTDIKFSVYMPSTANIGNARLQLAPGTSAVGNSSVCSTFASPGDNSRYLRVVIADAANPGNSRLYYISRANVCAEANQVNTAGNNPAGNVLYARYAFPATPASTESKTGLYKFDVTIEYGPGILAGLPDAGALRIFASIPTNGNAVLSPGTGSFAFPTVADWDMVDAWLNNRNANPSNYNHTIPFGMCNPSNTPISRKISLYDADNGPGSSFSPLEVRFRVYDLSTGTYVTFNNYENSGPYQGNNTFVRPADGTTNGLSSSAYFDLVPSHFYEMRILAIHVQNTIDIQLPIGSESAWGVPGICNPSIVPPPPTREAVTVQSFATGGGDVELGGSVTFNQGVTISNFPNRPSQWGFDEEAIRRADNTNTPPVQTPYNANNAGATGETAVVERQCQTGWAGSCANYTCNNGSIRTAATGCGNAVGGYRWRCAWNGKYDPQTGWTGGQNAPSCPNIVQYQCRDAAGNWQNQYRDFSSRSGSPGCPNQWNCWAPSGMPNTYDPNYGAGYCRVFKCAYDPNPGAYFYSPPGNNGDDRCDKRCSNGAGAPAPNWTGTGSDDNCYIQPSFTVTCTWQNNGVSESYIVTNNGNYCGAAPLTLPATSPGQLCAVTIASNSGWSSPPPGKGIDGNPAGTRTIWDIDLITPASACARVGLRPYFHAYGGDVNAAASFGPSCTQNPTTVRAFNNGTAGNNVGQTYTGSGSQLGVFSRGAIDGFTSKSQSATLPLALTFANTSGGWGGSWANNFCIPDNEWQQPDNTPSNVVGGGLVTTKDSRYYGNDDVYITGNTSYPPTYALANVPLLKIVTRGNVYIAAGVTDFSGVIMTTGKIYTCAVDNGAGGLRAPSGPEMFANCGNQLRVRGSFVADQVKLLRTVGSVRYAPPNPSTVTSGNAAPGEIFFYTPETWMQSPTPTPGTQNQTESLVNLPPVL